MKHSGAAQAVRSLLASADVHTTLWNEGFFRHGRSLLENLTTSLDSFDFAVLIATPDDLVITRNDALLTPRDNIIFELGLFMGKLGRDRTYLIHPRDPQLRLPSDLLGVVTASCSWPLADSLRGSRLQLSQYMSALGPACDQIRDALQEWKAREEANALHDPGLVSCYTNFSEAQAAIGRRIAASQSGIFLMAINFSWTPRLNIAEFRAKIDQGVLVRFMVLNPMTELLPYVARSIAMQEDDLRAENKVCLKTIMQLQEYADSRRKVLPSAGELDIRLFDSLPRGRSYVFDGPEGESFFVPYACSGPTRPLPVYHCTNRGQIAFRNIGGMEELWGASETIPIGLYMEKYPEFLE